MRHNHFSMLPEQAFTPRAFGSMTLEGGGGGGGGGESQGSVPTRNLNPRPVSPYQSAGGGFQGRTPFGTSGSSASFPENRFNADYYLQQNPDVARDPYYGQNPFHHFQDFGFQERRQPSETQEYKPSQQPLMNAAYVGQDNPNLVNQAYQSMLGRAPTGAEQQMMSGQMQRGLTGQGLAAFGAASPEFQRQREFERGYSEVFRPDYQEFGPSGQFYQPIYQSNYRNYMQPQQLYSPGYGGEFGGGMRNPFAYGGRMGGMGGGFPVDMPMMPSRSGGGFPEDPYSSTPNLSNYPRRMSAMQEGDDFVPRGPRPQVAPAEALRNLFSQANFQSGQAVPPKTSQALLPEATTADAASLRPSSSATSAPNFTQSQLASLLGGGSFPVLRAKGGVVDEGIAGLLNK